VKTSSNQKYFFFQQQPFQKTKKNTFLPKYFPNTKYFFIKHFQNNNTWTSNQVYASFIFKQSIFNHTKHIFHKLKSNQHHIFHFTYVKKFLKTLKSIKLVTRLFTRTTEILIFNEYVVQKTLSSQINKKNKKLFFLFSSSSIKTTKIYSFSFQFIKSTINIFPLFV
jgi:hypothetical protein